MKRIIVVLVFAMLASSLALFGQEFRGSITGQVLDSSGSLVPNAKVVAVNTKTNVATSTRTTQSGTYTIPFLMPGEYDVTASLTGFNDAVRKGVEVRVGDRIGLDLRLEVAGLQSAVEVTTGGELLQTATASMGWVVDRRRISELPGPEGNPMYLVQLAAGILFTNKTAASLSPFDSGGPASFVVGGAPGGSEITIDGAPNMGQPANPSTTPAGISYTPPMDAVQEFKVETVSYDAQQGHTAGATVNIILRSGTNEYHGSGYEVFRPQSGAARNFFLKRAGGQPETWMYHRFGGTTGGPIRIPHLYDGRNRSFFFVAFERLIWDTPSSSLRTVPSMAQRQGDFSGLLSQNMIMYDPLTAVPASGGRIQRSAFPGNIVPAARLTTVGKNVLTYYPVPNQTGNAQGQNNYLSTDNGAERYRNLNFRVDHNLTDKNRFFFRAVYNYNTTAAALGWAGLVNGVKPTKSDFQRGNSGITYDHVYLVSPTKVLNVRAGITRYYHTNGLDGFGFDPAKLGFPAQTLQYMIVNYFPAFTASGYDKLGATNGNFIAMNTLFFQPTLTWMHGRHSLRIGWDVRGYRQNNLPKRDPDGVYNFDTTYTRGPLDNSSGAAMGQSMVSLLLGIPGSGYIDRNTDAAAQTLYNGLFFQDDFRVNSKLTLNLGLRYELEGSPTERYNRNGRGFDLTSPSPIEAAAQAAYAANPDKSGLPVADFHVRGGMIFASSSNRGFWIADKNNFAPRVGVAYQLNRKLVLRGGWGMYTTPYNVDGIQQAGFSQATQLVTSLDGGLTFAGSLANPFPNGLLTAPGAAGGLRTYIGQSVSFTPLDRKNPQSHRYSIGLQAQLPGRWLLEGSYVGTRSYDIPVPRQLNTIPRQYLSTSPLRDTNVINYLTAKVTDPFKGLAPGTTLDASTIARSQLLLPYPQFTGITSEIDGGTSRYNSGMVRMERRFAQGFTLEGSYTRSRLRARTSMLNDTDAEPFDQISSDDRPTRVTISGVWELPIGKGRRWGHQWNSAVDSVLGGWQLGGIYIWQSGRPISLGNRYFSGDPNLLTTKYSTKKPDQPVFDLSGSYFHDAAVQTNGVDDPVKQRSDQRIALANNIRTLPNYLPAFRGAPITGLDLSMVKTAKIGERFKAQFRAEMVNSLNYVQFANPNTTPTSAAFGTVSSQDNDPRTLQLSVKLLF
jgi:hypothetical protein